MLRHLSARKFKSELVFQWRENQDGKYMTQGSYQILPPFMGTTCPVMHLICLRVNFNNAGLEVWLFWREPASLQEHRGCRDTLTPAAKHHIFFPGKGLGKAQTHRDTNILEQLHVY